MIAVSLLVLASWLFARADADSDTRHVAGVFAHAFFDMLRGAPSAGALAQTAHFDEAGIAFDYPAVLRRSDAIEDDGSRSWSFEYGMYSLELHAPLYALDAESYLGGLAGLLGGGRSIDVEGPVPGRTVTLCGRPITATRTRIRLMGDWSEQEGFDLPAAEGHQPRLLIFDDEPVGGAPSALAQATFARVTASLRCADPP